MLNSEYLKYRATEEGARRLVDRIYGDEDIRDRHGALIWVCVKERAELLLRVKDETI